jgi:hypothetical protein
VCGLAEVFTRVLERWTGRWESWEERGSGERASDSGEVGAWAVDRLEPTSTRDSSERAGGQYESLPYSSSNNHVHVERVPWSE